MNKLLINIILLLLLTACKIQRQFLPQKINETSGLEYYKNNFLTHNDSGGAPSLYEFTQQGDIINTYKILGCGINDDWEDITSDDENFYISNSGNNYGVRKNLSILILDKENGFQCKGQIQFRYKRQEHFENRNSHPYDSESIISVGNELILFSKDRKDLMTALYTLPKTPGSYEIEPIYSYNVNSLITGADYNEYLNLVSLVGYDFVEDGGESENQYLYTISNFNTENLDQSIIKKYKIPVGKAQIEAVKIIDESSFWITSEDEGNGFPRLFKFKI